LIHLPLVAAAAVLPLMGYPLVFLPVHIVWLELIIHPTALLAFQAEATAGPQASHRETELISRRDVGWIAAVSAVLVFGAGWLFVKTLSQEDHGSATALARTQVLALLTVWSAGCAVVLTRFRSRAANTLALLSITVAALLIGFAGELPYLRLAPLTLQNWLEILGTNLPLLAFVANRRSRRIK
jgi:Ca2+-transporting ATPase